MAHRFGGDFESSSGKRYNFNFESSSCKSDMQRAVLDQLEGIQEHVRSSVQIAMEPFAIKHSKQYGPVGTLVVCFGLAEALAGALAGLACGPDRDEFAKELYRTVMRTTEKIVGDLTCRQLAEEAGIEIDDYDELVAKILDKGLGVYGKKFVMFTEDTVREILADDFQGFKRSPKLDQEPGEFYRDLFKDLEKDLRDDEEDE